MNQATENINAVEDRQIIESHTPVIDPLLNEVVTNNTKFGLIESEGLGKSTESGRDGQSINLHIRHFEQNEIYKYFIYKDDIEPAMVHLNNCLVCNTEMIDASTLQDCRGINYLTLGLCPCCGFLQHTKRPPKHWYAQFYRKLWNPTKRDRSTWPTTLKVNEHVLSYVYTHVNPGSKVLEIGSGWGNALVSFKKLKCNAIGVEATEHKSEFIRSSLGMPCFTGEAEDVPIGTSPYEPESFDFIFSTNVLEHVYSTRQVIEHVYKLLKPDGLAYFEVPIYYQENLTLNTHGVSHTCNFHHPNFMYLLQSIGFDLVQDNSTPIYVSFLVRKSPALTEDQKISKLNWMKRKMPHKALAYLVEKNGLSNFMGKEVKDYSYFVEWYLGQKISDRFFRFEIDLPASCIKPLDRIRECILKRGDVSELKDILPIAYTYDFEGVPIWYY